MQSNLKVHNYDTNKRSAFLVNDINWNSRSINLNRYIKSEFLGNLKNINYDTQNIEKFKDSTTNELFGALGFLSEINFEKEQKNSLQILTPKLLLRYAPWKYEKRKKRRWFKIKFVQSF